MQNNWQQPLKRLFYILFPVLVYQLANFSAQLIDTMMTGNYHEVHLAGVSIGGNLWSPFFTLMTGTLSALTPIVGHHVGAQKDEEITGDTQQFIYLALILSAIMLVIGLVFIRPVLSLMNVAIDIQDIASSYLLYLAIGITPALLFTVLRSFVDGLGLTRISMAFMLLLVPFNIFFNYVLIYGRFGFPELGGSGAGLGTALTYWVVLVVVIVITRQHKQLKVYSIFRWQHINLSKIQQFIKVGLPIGLAIFVEVGVFASVGLLMSRYSATTIAAHQSAMNFATFLYGFPLSMSTALTIVISQELGRRDYVSVKHYSKLGIRLSVGIAAVLMLGLFLNRETVAQAYGKSDEFVALTVQFLSFALLFQFSDAVASPIQGILRGHKDTTMPFIIGAVSYWLIGIPVGMLLASYTTLGPISFWIGLIVGLFACGVLLSLRLHYLEKNFPV